MLWDCSIVFRSSLYDEQSNHHKFPMYKIKSNSLNLNCIQPSLPQQKQQIIKRLNIDHDKSRQLRKKKSLKTRLYSLKPKDQHQQKPVSLHSPTQPIFRHLPTSFVSPSHAVSTTRPCTHHQKEVMQSVHSTLTNYNSYFTKPHAILTPKDSFVDKGSMPVRINNSTPCSRGEVKIAFSSIPTPKNRVKEITRFNIEQKGPNIYEPMYEQNSYNNPEPLLKQFRKNKPIFKVTNLYNNHSPEIHIEINKSAKFCKYPEKQNNRTPKNMEEKQDKQNIVNKINPPTQFKIQDQRPTLPSISSTTSNLLDPKSTSINIRKGVKRIEDFLTSREEIKSVRDSDDISEHQRSQILTTYSTILKEHGKFQIDSRT